MKLDIILRTCDRGNVHTDWRTRYCQQPKNLLVLGCLRSLIRSCNQLINHTPTLAVLDDHSSPSTVNAIKDTLAACDFATEFVALEQRGYNNSCYQQYVRCRDSAADAVYAVEDDYLHCPTALQEMCDTYNIFRGRMPDRNIAIYPFDEPMHYKSPFGSFLVHGSARHWRNNFYTTGVFMASPQLIQQHWDTFEIFALKYNGNYLESRTEHVDEDTTLNKIWAADTVLFSPVPSLALHLQFDDQRDPYINWVQWWMDYAQ